MGSRTGEREGLRPLLVLAERQGGFFTTGQARDVGVSGRMLSYYVSRLDLERDSYGVYRLRWLPRHEFGDVVVTCLWSGGVASHDTALAVRGISDAMPPVVHVTVSGEFRGQRRGAVVHQAALADDESTVVDDVPVTTIERSISDVAGRDPALARQALDDAIAQGRSNRRRLVRAARRYPALEPLIPAPGERG